MANAFDDLYKQQLNITTVKVESAVKLDDASKQQLLNLVKTKVTGQIELVEKVNPELIGGFIITINDTQIDQSVRTKLNQLRKNFSTNLYLPELN
jgi:F-type H+-transporting ATPase subunit delta